jgi:DNA-directed RNA polymerase specialized sigma subunit
MAPKKHFVPDDHLKQFAARLEKKIAAHGELKNRSQAEDRQRSQLKLLLELEDQFRLILQADARGEYVYREFINYICDTRRNILDGRTYFRERQKLFTKLISPAFKARNAQGLYEFRINYQFVTFTLGLFEDWDSANADLVRLAQEISDVRNALIEINSPLIMNRARLFWSRTPKSHLTLMDFLQIGCMGFISGVDKYVPIGEEIVPRGFRSVAIGRMTGNFIENYSETSMHFFPTDKRKIYWANKLIHKHADGVDYERLAAEVNEALQDPLLVTNAAEIRTLLSAASTVSADSSVTQTENYVESVARFAAPSENRPDTRMEEKDAMQQMLRATSELSLFEKKILLLKGIPIEL